jgi:predicted acylesterase/phospholipase RssA
MARMLNGSDMHYDVISGISVGAINSGALAVHEKGDEVAATEFLRQVWMNMTSGSIYQAWPGHEVYEAFFNQTSLFDTSPLRTTLETILA